MKRVVRNPLLLVDFYKVHHHRMYPDGTVTIYSNFTPRKSRIAGVDSVVFFGLQYFVLEYLIDGFKYGFFDRDLEDVLVEYKKHVVLDDYSHIAKLHALGYLPIEIKALPEGTLCPIGVPCFTIKNTHHDHAWLTNYLETLISCMMWQPITSATIANEYRKILNQAALRTTGSTEGVQWQGHDFSMRGMSSVESSIVSGMGHLTCFTGTDTIPAIYALEDYYGGAPDVIGASVPATEHSVMCMGMVMDGIDQEKVTFLNLMEKYPSGILSVVSDTRNFWDVVGPNGVCFQLREEILEREGKLVIRPDSGDPVEIICGKFARRYRELKNDPSLRPSEVQAEFDKHQSPEDKGALRLLWETFGGKEVWGADNRKYKVLDPHIGLIYGDSITPERAKEIVDLCAILGFASTNTVFGIGSFTYQFNTRDTFGFAMKATYGEVKVPTGNLDEDEQSFKIQKREIYKDPVTDDGTKKSKKGLLSVRKINTEAKGEVLMCFDGCTPEEENDSLLKTVFLDGKLVKKTSLQEIRERIKNE